MAGNGELLGRLLKLITMIQGDHRWRPASIAEHLGVGERTVYRDLQRLKEGGVPVAFDKGSGGTGGSEDSGGTSGGYYIRRGFFLPPIDLSAEEACALLLLAERVGGADHLPMTRPAASAIEKLRGGLPEALRDAVGEMLPNIHFHLAAGESEGNEDAWSTVSHAIAHRVALRCEYESANSDGSDGPAESFCFHPYHLYWGQRAWYAIGMHHGRGEVRTLRLARFTRIEPTEDSFDIPEAFSLQDYLGHAWRMIPGDRVQRRVVLRFDPQVAETVAETFWHRSQEIDYHDDGSITARFEIDGLDEIGWWILGYGPYCEVVEPRELRDQVAELINAAARRYAGGSQ